MLICILVNIEHNNCLGLVMSESLGTLLSQTAFHGIAHSDSQSRVAVLARGSYLVLSILLHNDRNVSIVLGGRFDTVFAVSFLWLGGGGGVPLSSALQYE